MSSKFSSFEPNISSSSTTILNNPFLSTSFLLILSALWAYYIGRKGNTIISRLCLCFPSLLILVYLPFCFNRLTQPFFVYAASGIFSWWSAFKLLSFCLGRGPLIDPKHTLKSFTLIYIVPAAFITKEKQKLLSLTTLQVSGRILLLYFISKFISSQLLVVLIEYLHQYTIPCTTTTGVPSSIVSPACTLSLRCLLFLEHWLFSWVVYMCFSFVMDLPLGLVKSNIFGINPNQTAYFHTVSHFDKPYLSISFREFWNYRWNLSAGTILRELIYEPIIDYYTGSGISHIYTSKNDNKHISTTISQNNNKNMSSKITTSPGEITHEASQPSIPPRPTIPVSIRVLGVLATFFVSGLCHEMIMFHCSSYAGITGNMIAFFTLNGLMCCIEPIVETQFVYLYWKLTGQHNPLTVKDQLKQWKVHNRMYRIIRRFITLCLISILAELFWWTPFTKTQLDERMLNEWKQWQINGLWFVTMILNDYVIHVGKWIKIQ